MPRDPANKSEFERAERNSSRSEPSVFGIFNLLADCSFIHERTIIIDNNFRSAVINLYVRIAMFASPNIIINPRRIVYARTHIRAVIDARISAKFLLFPSRLSRRFPVAILPGQRVQFRRSLQLNAATIFGRA